MMNELEKSHGLSQIIEKNKNFTVNPDWTNKMDPKFENMTKEEVLKELLRQSNMDESEKMKMLEQNAEKIYTEVF
jgi:hypothetical protein